MPANVCLDFLTFLCQLFLAETKVVVRAGGEQRRERRYTRKHLALPHVLTKALFHCVFWKSRRIPQVLKTTQACQMLGKSDISTKINSTHFQPKLQGNRRILTWVINEQPKMHRDSRGVGSSSYLCVCSFLLVAMLGQTNHPGCSIVVTHSSSIYLDNQQFWEKRCLQSKSLL